MARKKPISAKAQQVRAQERQALTMRLAGWTYQDIAVALRYASPQHAWKVVNRALRRETVKVSLLAEDLREVELTRLDRMQSSIWNTALGIARQITRQEGNTQVTVTEPIPHNQQMDALDRVLKIMERRAKYDGTEQAPAPSPGAGIDAVQAVLKDALQNASIEEIQALRAVVGQLAGGIRPRAIAVGRRIEQPRPLDARGDSPLS